MQPPNTPPPQKKETIKNNLNGSKCNLIVLDFFVEKYDDIVFLLTLLTFSMDFDNNTFLV